MPYYIVERKCIITEKLIVKARSEYDAFAKAGDDIDCKVISEHEGDYEPVYDSIIPANYVSPQTVKEIG